MSGHGRRNPGRPSPAGTALVTGTARDERDNLCPLVKTTLPHRLPAPGLLAVASSIRFVGGTPAGVRRFKHAGL
eukprot:scaffold28522_cov77-Phaeocystis_antarctica.AAC.1